MTGAAEMPRKIAVIGAGNIGTAMAALLGASGAEVTVVARGARLDALRRSGVCLEDRGDLHTAPVTAVTHLESPQEAVFLCVKAQDLGAAVTANRAGIGPQTLVIPMVNGLPFWFRMDQGARVPHTDPGMALAAHLYPEQILGAVLLMTVRMDGQGRAISSNTPTLSLGPVVPGVDPARAEALVALLEASGVRTDLSEGIRQKVMVKLLANVATNPLSALTGHTLSALGGAPQLLAVVHAVADEMRAWAKGAGYDLPGNDWLTDLLLDAGDFPTSMLQDARAGRPLELDAIIRAPLSLGRGAGHPMPVLNHLLTALTGATKLPLPASAQAALLADLTQTHSLRILERTPS
jgi:2-dehydropantoate 2-reductase